MIDFPRTLLFVAILVDTQAQCQDVDKKTSHQGGLGETRYVVTRRLG